MACPSRAAAAIASRCHDTASRTLPVLGEHHGHGFRHLESRWQLEQARHQRHRALPVADGVVVRSRKQSGEGVRELRLIREQGSTVAQPIASIAMPAELHECHRRSEMALRRSRIDRERAFVEPKRVGRLACLPECVGEREVRFDVLRVGGDRGREALDRIRPSPAKRQDHAGAVVTAGKCRRAAHGRVEVLQRAGRVLQLE